MTDAWTELKGGVLVPTQALLLALDLEARGFLQRVTPKKGYSVRPMADLTATDREDIRVWRRYLATIVSYRAPEMT